MKRDTLMQYLPMLPGELSQGSIVFLGLIESDLVDGPPLDSRDRVFQC